MKDTDVQAAEGEVCDTENGFQEGASATLDMSKSLNFMSIFTLQSHALLLLVLKCSRESINDLHT